MHSYDKTTFVSMDPAVPQSTCELAVTIFDGMEPPRTITLGSYGKSVITFGRSESNDIVLSSKLVSREHGRFRLQDSQWMIEDKALYGEKPSENGLIYNNYSVRSRNLADGDFIRIDDGIETVSEGVLFVFSNSGVESAWKKISVSGKQELTIGRNEECDIVLPHITVSRLHAKIACDKGKHYILDCGSTNGVIVNNRRIDKRQLLHEKDVIAITNAKLIFTSSAISYCCYRTGISVDVTDATIVRGKGKKTKITGNHIFVNIKPGELVAIIGGSGTGKSTILNCMSGYLPPEKGSVYINGINLYDNFEAIKKLIGYVPQNDIVYDNLTLSDMLSYTARLRLPKDASEKEIEEAVRHSIKTVELEEKRNDYIRKISGGQRKRASIAVELLSDPNLLFLDEPASGLDPGTEKKLMKSLRQMADEGKTVILVTHSTLQLKLCDKILIMGTGGNLCFLGSYEKALGFFGVSDIIDVYGLTTDNASEWRKKYDSTMYPSNPTIEETGSSIQKEQKEKFQLPILCSRYLKLVINDRQRLLLLLLQAPILSFLISLVANGQQFEQYEITESLLFALSCSGFWVGMLNAIQEICKERDILKREYMAGLSLNSYVLSKIMVLGIMCIVQCALIIAVFAFTVGMPEKGLILNPYLEMFITTYLTAAASAAMGLFVSSFFTNADRAMTVAPLLLMPQILFSGLIFTLEGATEIISYFAICRWSMEGYGTTANLNELPLRLQLLGVNIAHTAEDFFEYMPSHIMKVWGMLFLFVVFFLLMSRIVLSRLGKEAA